jgi:general nucleoside transport system ATP-binding protein
MTAPLIVARGIDKSFGAVAALTKAGVTLREARVTAIVGENGAGKSTLAKIITGILRPDRGEILLKGEPVTFRRRADAIAAGIGFVPQSLSFIVTLTLAENHLIGRTGFIADRRQAERELSVAAKELGVDLPFHVPLERLSLPERQLGEIASAVASGARVLLLDEPTSTLGPVEIERLIGAIRRLAGAGTAIGLVTHRITEVLSGADDVAVLRGGVPVSEGPTTGLNADTIARMMVGTSVPPALKFSPHSDDIRVVVEKLGVTIDGIRYLDDVSLDVRAGEILGIAGVASNSQTLLAEILVGLRRPDQGRVRIAGHNITGDAVAARRLGVAHIPDDRTEGIVPTLTVAENASLLRLNAPAFTRFVMRNKRAEHDHAARIAERNDVRPRQTGQQAMALSGGNQQKLLVGRELDGRPIVVVAHGPTQGLDINAAAAIRRQLVDIAAEGAPVVVISADLDEILSMSHRVIVLTQGRIAGQFDLRAGRPDMVRLGRAMGGTAAQAA